jgi:phosphate-selective porin OprO/OprP
MNTVKLPKRRSWIKWSWPRKWPKRAFALGAGALLALGTARAQEPSTPAAAGAPAAAAQPSMNDLLKRLDQLEKSNQELKKKLESKPAGGAEAQEQQPSSNVSDDSVRKIISDYLKNEEAAKAAAVAKEREDGVKVYSKLNLEGYLDNNGYPWLATPHRDFTLHVGSWVQWDNVWFDQSGGMLPPAAGRAQTAAIRAATNAMSGQQFGGVGDLQDGTYFRRIRPFMEGTFWEDGEFRLNLALENIQSGSTGLDEFWVGWNNLPIIGTIRAGHIKSTVGFEGDMTASSRTMTFMERSLYSTSIENNLNFVTGLWFGNNFLDQHMTYSANLARVDPGQMIGASFGDGQWFAAGRLTFLPLYADSGRHWLHLGVNSSWRNGNNDTNGNGNAQTGGGITTQARMFQLNSAVQLRDNDPANGGAGAGAGPQSIANALNPSMVNTGVLAAANDMTLGTELCYVRGPLSFQAEYGWNFLNGVYGAFSNGVGVTPPVPPGNPPFTRFPSNNYVFNGGYVQVAYTLTGEARGYDRARGTLSRAYFQGGPFSPAFFHRNTDGGWCHSLGAIEVAARYDYTNLNAGTGNAFRINGGTMQGVTLGLNWYLNSNMTIMADYVWDYRYNFTQTGVAGTTVNPGTVDGFGTRVQLSF